MCVCDQQRGRKRRCCLHLDSSAPPKGKIPGGIRILAPGRVFGVRGEGLSGRRMGGG